ncbi:hypothetical protein V7T02_00945 [Segatella copri]|uniref:hypothetical protein n=1 Tax=Segatella copri TaxID=165179 RepID=UPI002FF3675A
MKKFFTLVCGLAMALCANASEQISTAFGSWGDGCTVEGNTLTFTEAWKGAGVNFTTGDGETEPKKCTDFSDYDYLWVTFSETTCDFKLCTQYTLNYNQDVSVEAISGTLVLGVKLNENYSDQFAQYYLQSKATGKLVVTGAYVGTEEEYKAMLAGNKPKKSDLTLTDLGSGWGNSTYDAATKTVTIGDDWSGKGWWLEKADYSDFDKVVINFASATTANGKVVVEYNGDKDGSSAEFAEGATSVEVELKADFKNTVKQIYIQGPAGSTYTLASAYVCVKDYVATGISQAIVAPAAKSSKIYNLAGQEVSKSYKGVVIKNGKKYVQ